VTPIDLDSLRRTIAKVPEGAEYAASVSRVWLEQVERELVAGRAARAELAGLKSVAAVQQALRR